MDFLRSVFVSVFIAFIFAAFFFASTELVRGVGLVWSWLGLGLSALGPIVFFSWVFIAKPARTSPHPLGITLVSGLGLAITMLMSWRYGDTAGTVHIWAGAVFISWIIYLRWYSTFLGRSASVLTVGNQLPEFELQNTEGVIIRSDSFAGKAHILVFHRGNWCPFCMAQITELAEQFQKITAAGAVVAFISPQPLVKNQSLARRFDVALEFYCDPKSRATKLLGIAHTWGTPMGMQLFGYDSDSVLPTVIITDKTGKILYTHQTDNYRIRPEPTEFLGILAKSRL